MQLETHQQAAIIASLVFPWLLEKVKNTARIPWVTANSDSLNKTLSRVFALGMAAGFTFHLEGSLIDGGVLHLAFPPLEQMLQFAFHSGMAVWAQEITYRGLVKPKAVAARD